MEKHNMPRHIAVILDGNRRWARKKNLPVFMGHKKGADKLIDFAKWCGEFGIREATFYAFSRENFNRSKKEVDFLMGLFKELFKRVMKKKNLKLLEERGIRIRFIGDRALLSRDISSMMREIEKATGKNRPNTANFAIAYGGRQEIVRAARLLARLYKSGRISRINEEEFVKHLWLRDFPDLILRPGGEKRLSNFLTYQSAYSELIFSDTLWPDFSRRDFEEMIKEYSSRERRFGR